MIEFYDVSKDSGDYKKFIIKTEANDPKEFIIKFADMLTGTLSVIFQNSISMKDDKNKKLAPGEMNNVITDLIHQLDLPYLFKNFAEIYCKLRGYKADVMQKMVTVSHGAMPTGEYFSRLDDKGQFSYTKTHLNQEKKSDTIITDKQTSKN